MSTLLAADGSSALDAAGITEIDPTDPMARWQYSCPNGHVDIDPTNGGIWCATCARDPSIEDPHHHAILDKRTGEEIPWSRVDWQG